MPREIISSFIIRMSLSLLPCVWSEETFKLKACDSHRKLNWEVTAGALTQYSTSVQPSMVMHWNTVSMANRKLSKLVMPPLGPCQPSRHSLPLMGHWRPCPEIAHGAGSSSANPSIGREERKQCMEWYVLYFIHFTANVCWSKNIGWLD